MHITTERLRMPYGKVPNCTLEVLQVRNVKRKHKLISQTPVTTEQTVTSLWFDIHPDITPNQASDSVGRAKDKRIKDETWCRILSETPLLCFAVNSSRSVLHQSQKSLTWPRCTSFGMKRVESLLFINPSPVISDSYSKLCSYSAI